MFDSLNLSHDNTALENIIKFRCPDILSVAKSVGKTCRYGGSTDRVYSVLQHAIIVHDIAIHDDPSLRDRPEVLLALLFHDNTEMFVGDCISPFKPRIMYDIEEIIAPLILQHVGMPAIDWKQNWDFVKRYDREAFRAEWHLLDIAGQAYSIREVPCPESDVMELAREWLDETATWSMVPLWTRNATVPAVSRFVNLAEIYASEVNCEQGRAQ